MTKEEIQVGAKVWFAEEKQGYTVQARDERFMICTKPFNPRKTYLYSIVDFERGIRGPDNLIFGSYKPYNTKEGAEANLVSLNEKPFPTQEVSHRRKCEINIVKFKNP